MGKEIVTIHNVDEKLSITSSPICVYAARQTALFQSRFIGLTLYILPLLPIYYDLLIILYMYSKIRVHINTAKVFEP